MQQQAASRLLSDIRRAPDLFPYQEETVRGLLQEITSLSQGVQERLRDTERDAEGRPRHRVLNEVQKCFLRRYKRCLVVYHSARCDRVENLRWNTGAVLPAAKRENMHSSEVDYFKAYSGLVSKYLDSCKLDLTASLNPPKLDRVAVQAISDCGVVQTASGPRNVNKGETHFMSRADCEPLIRQGLMQQVPMD